MGVPLRNDSLKQTTVQRETLGDSKKTIFKAPIIGNDPEMQRIVNKIYDDINTLVDAVNSGDAANVDYTGKIGDIRIVAHKTDPLKQVLQGFTKNGWMQFGESTKVVYKGEIPDEDQILTKKEINTSSIPRTADFDTGWIDKAASITLNHNLDTRDFSNISIQTCADAGITDPVAYWIHTQVATADYMIVTVSKNEATLTMDVTGQMAKIRCRLWK